MSIENPVTRIRKSTGHTVHSFANLLQCSIPVITQVEAGALERSPKVFNALASLGFGTAKALQADYTAWRKQKTEAARAEITGQMDQAGACHEN